MDFDGGFKLKKTSERAFSERYGRIELYLPGFSAAWVVVDAREMEHENGRVQIRKFSTVRFLI